MSGEGDDAERVALAYSDHRPLLAWLHGIITDEVIPLDTIDWLDLELLPKLELIQKYSTLNVTSMSSVEDGFLVVDYSPFKVSKEARDDGEE